MTIFVIHIYYNAIYIDSSFSGPLPKKSFDSLRWQFLQPMHLYQLFSLLCSCCSILLQYQYMPHAKFSMWHKDPVTPICRCTYSTPFLKLPFYPITHLDYKRQALVIEPHSSMLFVVLKKASCNETVSYGMKLCCYF